MARAARIVLVGAVPARVLLDLCWRVQLPGGWSAGQVGGAVLVLLAAVLAAARPRSWPSVPGAAAWAAWVVVVAIGAVRAPGLEVGANHALQLLTPAVVLAAWTAWHPAIELPTAWTRTAWVPVVASLAALALGQPAEHVLHGWPRLLGAYGNLHGHAAAMALFATTGAALALRGVLRAEHAALALAAGTCLLLTWVRAELLFVPLALGVVLVGRRRAGWALLGAMLLPAAVGLLWGRMGDVVAVLTLTPPEGGWAALGSFRGAIWADATARWWAEGPVSVLLGRGLGGQLGLHRHLDPHSELLSLLFQVGVVGVTVYAVAFAGVLHRLWRSTHPLAPLALGLVVAAGAVGLVGNDVLLRPTVVWWIASVAALASRPEDGLRAGA
ncbi:MAG: hypothetical protein H6738_11295 [Alphaproteobacteria bacterium]|nr:hypothetical protein [Alphaproteobacteria bacterium]MCB9697355.1 hypothetical protein [Alphaproteobacteria bacterium]